MADLQGTRRCEDNTGEHLSNPADHAWISTYGLDRAVLLLAEESSKKHVNEYRNGHLGVSGIPCRVTTTAESNTPQDSYDADV
jgi:hypothetical protein